MLSNLLIAFSLLFSDCEGNSNDPLVQISVIEWAHQFNIFDKYKIPVDDQSFVIFDGFEYNYIETCLVFSGVSETLIPVLQKTRQNLKLLPDLEDLNLFPGTDFVSNCSKMNGYVGQYLWDIKNFMPPWKQEVLSETIQENELICEILNNIIKAQNEDLQISERRAGLFDLKQSIGAENYYSGRLPAPYPYWRFRD